MSEEISEEKNPMLFEVKEWKIHSETKEAFHVSGVIPVEKEGFYLLSHAYNGSKPLPGYPLVEKVTLNGKDVDFSRDAQFAYCVKSKMEATLEVFCKKGDNHIEIWGSGSAPDLENFIWFSLYSLPEYKESVSPYRKKLTLPSSQLFSADQEKEKEDAPDLTGFIPGCGCTPAPGRFAFLKGDGVLDCAMPALGIIDKMYLYTHPRYKKPFRWNYSTLPAGAAIHGSARPANVSIENDDIKVNPLSVRWEASFGKERFACTYSLGTPGIITEYTGGVMRLSSLQFTSNYQYILIPRKNGELEVCDIDHVDDLTMGENFLLLFGSREFPDLPLLLVFEKQPSFMKVTHAPRSNRLSEIEFGNCSLIITSTPFGLESFDPISPDDETFLARAAELCRFWSRAFLAYPVDYKEYYKNDPEKETTSIVEMFSFRYIKDEWGTKALELAVLPPAGILSEGMQYAAGNMDLKFPTKYGPLYGKQGSVNRYTIDWMPDEGRKFPLEDKDMPSVREKLQEGFDSYFDLIETYPESFQAYPYAGALMEPYAYASGMMHFLDEKWREKIRERLAQRLKTACDPLHTYDYAVINHGFMMKTAPDDELLKKIYADPEMSHRKLWNWYEREEPFTGITYHICYLNVSMLRGTALKTGTPEEVRNSKIPFIENDWGCGLTFYYMLLSALACGDFSAIKENWKLILSVYSFFEKMHDFACMGTGYSDSGITWVEGANYGVFHSFIRLAQAVGDPDAVERGRYIAAKQFALRRGIVRSGENYFWKYFECEPYYITKAFYEESSPFNNRTRAPSLRTDKNNFSSHGFYNLTTEGIYPELYEHMRSALGSYWDTVIGKMEQFLREVEVSDPKEWGKVQSTAALLTNLALDERCSTERLEELIRIAEEKNILMQEWRGIHIFSRRLPKNFFVSQVRAWNRMKQHKAWLLHWQDVQIKTAQWDGKRSCAEITLNVLENPVLQLGIRSKAKLVLLNGREIPFTATDKTLTVRPDCGGMLEIIF